MTEQAKNGDDAHDVEPAARGLPFMAVMGLLVGFVAGFG
jgi:hypothetical protein